MYNFGVKKLRYLLVPTLIITIGFLFSGCTKPKNNTQAENQPEVSKTYTQTTAGPFTGTLPCPDCKGIETSLKFYFNAVTSVAEKYSMTETYIGETSPLSSQGKLEVISENGKTIYHLDPDKAEFSRFFLKIDENSIKELDKNSKEFKTKLNYTLSKGS
jgi:hypothetical protein